MLDNSISSVAVLAPHADDEVLGAGGLLAACKAQNISTNVLVLAVDGSEHYGYQGRTSLSGRLEELALAADILGFRYDVAYPGKDLLERLDTVPLRSLVDLIQDWLNAHKPDLLLLPHGEDYDQDHVACFQAAYAATRPIPTSLGKHLATRVATYESPKLQWSSRPFNANLFFDTSDYLDKKLEALAAYTSQARQVPHVRSPENIRALAILRGSEIGVRYAEGFNTLRWVM